MIVWQKAHKFVLCVYQFTGQFHKTEIYGLTSQFRRAAISIPANICEGFKNTVDHYRSRENYRNLAYEWSNLRFASAWINSSKGTLDDQVLDPLDLGEDWFEILLPSLQLVLTDKVPPQQRQKAEFTLERLRLRDDERVLRQRQQWYQLYFWSLD